MEDLRVRVAGWALSPKVLVVFVVAAVGFGVALFALRHQAEPRKPFSAAAPTHAYPVSVGVNGSCQATDGLPAEDSTSARVWVDPDPDGAVALWVPSVANVACFSTLTRLDAGQAQAIAAAVRTASPVPSGPGGKVSCLGAFPRPVTIFLTYPARAEAEVVQVRLDQGCVSSFITAPGRTRRQLPAALAAVLRSTAPQPWAAWL